MFKKKRMFFLVLAVLLLVIVIVLLIQFSKKSVSPALSYVKKLEVVAEAMPISNSSLILFDNGVITEAEGDSIKVRDIKGDILWNLKLDDNIKTLFSCGLNLVVITEGNNILTIDNLGKKLWDHKLITTLTTVMTDDKEFILIQYSLPQGNMFEIYSINGIKVCMGHIKDSHVLSFSAFEDKYFTISFMDISGNKVLNKVITYNETGEILWAHNFEEELILRVGHSSKGNVILAGEKSLRLVKSSGKVSKEIDFDNPISNIEISDNLMVFILQKGNHYEIYAYDLNLKERGSLAIKDKPRGIFLDKDSYIAFYKDSLTLFNGQGNVIAVYEATIDIDKAYIWQDKKVFIISRRKLLKLS